MTAWEEQHGALSDAETEAATVVLQGGPRRRTVILQGPHVVPVECDAAQVDRVAQEVKRRRMERAFELTEQADRERVERHERWVAAKTAGEEARAKAHDRLVAEGKIEPPDPTRYFSPEEVERRRKEKEREEQEAKIRYRGDPPFADYERVTTAELNITDWRKSFCEDNFPDDFLHPDDPRNY